ncbi:MAG TPA: hypothetical protein VGF84_16680 [Micromonosporaceae bacterium]|jgi:hypothetical protein
MALLHKADLRPTKLELLESWLPSRGWAAGASAVERVAAFRFDDPDDEVGIETMLVRADGGPVLHVPLTYRAAPLAGGDAYLIGTTDHSVLGPRWVYDACGDPVYAGVLAHTILTGGREADEFVDDNGRLVPRAPMASALGSGSPASADGVRAAGAIVEVTDGDPTIVVADTVELRIARSLGTELAGSGDTLSATWNGQSTPVVLARARPL